MIKVSIRLLLLRDLPVQVAHLSVRLSDTDITDFGALSRTGLVSELLETKRLNE